MSAFRGRVEKRDLEGGIFQLVADDGKRYTLVGSTSGLQAGAEVEIDGEVEAVKSNIARLEAEVHELKDLLAKVCAKLGII